MYGDSSAGHMDESAKGSSVRFVPEEISGIYNRLASLLLEALATASISFRAFEGGTSMISLQVMITAYDNIGSL